MTLRQALNFGLLSDSCQQIIKCSHILFQTPEKIEKPVTSDSSDKENTPEPQAQVRQTNNLYQLPLDFVNYF